MSLDISLKQDVDFGGPDGPETQILLDRDFTHNMIPLWKYLGVYDALYMSHGKLAREVYPALLRGVNMMKIDPEMCCTYDAENGWGTFKDAQPWLQEVTEAFRKYPNAIIEVNS